MAAHFSTSARADPIVFPISLVTSRAIASDRSRSFAASAGSSRPCRPLGSHAIAGKRQPPPRASARPPPASGTGKLRSARRWWGCANRASRWVPVLVRHDHPHDSEDSDRLGTVAVVEALMSGASNSSACRGSRTDANPASLRSLASSKRWGMTTVSAGALPSARADGNQRAAWKDRAGGRQVPALPPSCFVTPKNSGWEILSGRAWCETRWDFPSTR